MRPAPDTVAAVLGAATVVVTVAAAVLSRSAAGPGALVAAIVSLAGLASTAAAFFVAVARTPLRRRAGLGLGLALAAWPIGALVTAVAVGPR